MQESLTKPLAGDDYNEANKAVGLVDMMMANTLFQKSKPLTYVATFNIGYDPNGDDLFLENGLLSLLRNTRNFAIFRSFNIHF